MPTWLQLARGPAFHFALAIFLLGLARLIILSVIEMSAAVHRAGDRRIPYVQVIKETLSWLFPFKRLHRVRGTYSFASFGFHLGILSAGLLLANHIDIFAASLGLAWPALYKPVIDGLTLVTIVCGFYLLLFRIYVPASRRLSGMMDYLLLVLILNIFLSGFVAGRAWNPFPYDWLMLFHTINGLGVLILAPFTKIAHCILFPVIRLGSEIAWHFPPGGGSEVVQALHGPEGRKV